MLFSSSLSQVLAIEWSSGDYAIGRIGWATNDVDILFGTLELVCSSVSSFKWQTMHASDVSLVACVGSRLYCFDAALL